MNCLEKFLREGEERSFGQDRQLLITVRARDSKGRVKYLKALIDTGAEANLVKEKLLHENTLKKSENPLRLITADGTTMPGG